MLYSCSTTVTWDEVATFLQALLTPAIGVATVAIGVIALRIHRQQAITNRLQFRLALFERRMKVFDATMDLIAAVLRDARVDLPRAFQFLRETREHELLFGPDVKEFIEELYHKAVDLHTIDATANPDDIPKTTEILNWFAGRSDAARRTFLRYIDFREP